MRNARTAKFALSALLQLSIAGRALAYDPPAGGLLIPLYGSPRALGSGYSVTGLDRPWADRLNPAASAAQQRPVLDAGYTLLSDFGAEGVGTALALGLSLPQAYGVWGLGLRFASVPQGMDSLPVGTLLEARGGIAKDLFPRLYVGAAVNVTLGGNQGFGWGLNADLGAIHKLGDLGFLKDFRYGAVLSGIGKGYGTPVPANSSSYPAAFSLYGGARATLYKTDALRLGMAADLSLPSFQDLGFGLSAQADVGKYVSVDLGWGFPSVRELAGGQGRRLLPSLGVSASIPIERQADDSFLAKQGWNQGELVPTVSAAPLYGNVWGIGTGASIPLGVVDKKPPEISASFPATAWGSYYLSPNNDGIKDFLEIPVSMTDRRYIVSYAMTIRKAGGGEVIRTVANKESRPETFDFSGIWSRLVYIKTGIPVPPQLSWNGVADSGELAPDGAYEVLIEAVDDNGNRGQAGPFPIVVDASPPTADLRLASDSPIFSPDGDGNKDEIRFSLSGSVEDLWSLSVRNAAGRPIRSLEYKAAAPADFLWDGRDDDGMMVGDGVYSIQLTSQDRAGNAFTGRLGNIVVNTLQPPINLSIDTNAFSPNGDGSKDVLRLSTSVPVKTGLLGFEISVLDRDKKPVWTSSSTEANSLKELYLFDGRGQNLGLLPEGSYQAKLSVRYQNGHSPIAFSPSFLIDLSPPSAQVKADRSAFNPAGSGGQDRVLISQSGSSDERWIGEMLGADGRSVRNWDFGIRLEPSLEWDGTDDAGAPVADGVYTYRLKATDRAGNSFASQPVSVSVDTVKKEARVAADLRVFSPNGDGQKDQVRIAAEVKYPELLSSFELALVNAESPAGKPLKTWKGSRGLPDTFVWNGLGDDGKPVPEGRYLALLKAAYLNADSVEARSLPIGVDITGPSISVKADTLLFSPNGDGRLDLVRFAQSSSPGDDWEGRIVGPDGAAVRTLSWRQKAEDFSWDGSDEAGNRVPDGIYRYEVSSVDAAGNRGGARVPGVRVDARQAQVFVTASAPGLSPNADGVMDDLAFTLIVNLREGISSWSFSLLDSSGATRAGFGGEGGDIPSRIVWDGKSNSGAVLEGSYEGVFRVSYAKGDSAEARTGGIVVDVTGPEVGLRLSPDFFSPDNDGQNDELFFDLALADRSGLAEWRLEVDEASVEETPGKKPEARLFIVWSGKGAPAKRIVWDGRSTKGELVEAATDYPFVFEARDAYGNGTLVSGTIAVDVLVIREDDRLKIKVPSIVFRPNYADFQGLAKETVDRNRKVAARIAEILNKFKDYRIAIEGHANSIAKIYGYSEAKIGEEETKELIPLSTARAELVRSLLVEYGVDPRRLSVLGRGSSAPVVDFKDSVNRWKNRRVEFVLIKNP